MTHTPSRDALADTWVTLTRTTLPELARTQNWPIRHDHCFMRVCFDHAAGRPWHEIVHRPAIRHMPDTLLIRAIAVAQHIVDNPGDLRLLNDSSLTMRRKSKAKKASAT